MSSTTPVPRAAAPPREPDGPGSSVTPARPGEHDSDAGTRRRVLDLIACDGPVSAAELAVDLDLTAAAIRRHLSVLEVHGQIGVHDAAEIGPVRRGRPAKRYVVTADGQATLTQQYSGLASQALRFVAEIGGADAVRHFAERRGLELERRHADALAEAGDDVVQRARVLAEGLAQEGFAATVRPVPGGAAIQLCQGHCPVQDIASEFPELCEAEAHAFSRMLGVHVQRLATLARGGHVCTTNIPIMPVRRSTAPAPTPDRTGPPPAPAFTSPRPVHLTEGRLR